MDELSLIDGMIGLTLTGPSRRDSAWVFLLRERDFRTGEKIFDARRVTASEAGN
jgi:hypothetical protein